MNPDTTDLLPDPIVDLINFAHRLRVLLIEIYPPYESVAKTIPFKEE